MSRNRPVQAALQQHVALLFLRDKLNIKLL
jgi:hypothetical protein